MTETPRTDAAIVAYESGADFNGPGVIASFARELERENAALREDKARLDWLLSRCSVGTHVLGHKGQSHFAFLPFFTLRVQGGGREGIDDAMQNAAAIAAIERQFEDAEFNRTRSDAARRASP